MLTSHGLLNQANSHALHRPSLYYVFALRYVYWAQQEALAQRLMTVVQSGVSKWPRSKQQPSRVGFPPHTAPDAAAQYMLSLKQLCSDFTRPSTYSIPHLLLKNVLYIIKQ